jgi:molybdate transport system substrate-binding protein
MERLARLVGVFVVCCTVAAAATAAEVRVAVAANFSAPMKRIAAAFEADTLHKVALIDGATGVFYAQIKSGAPFDVFLAADEETPARLEREGFALPGMFTYATGRLVLWGSTPGVVDEKGEVLRRAGRGHIAIANPAVAPYGAAAMEVMTRLGLIEALRPRFVQGENIAQTYLYVATGNVEMGFVALSQVMVEGQIARGSGWVIPSNLHSPIRQAAVVLARARDNAGAMALASYLRGDKAKAIIRAFGYEF